MRKKQTKILKSAIISALLLILGAVIGHYTEKIFNNIEAKYDMGVVMFSDVGNDQFPITIQNTGDKTLIDLEIGITSCNMDVPKFYYLTDLEKGQEYTVEFQDEKTLLNYKKRDCVQGKINISDFRFEITPYRDNRTGKIYSPTLNTTIFVCGTCFWNITVNSSEYYESFYEGVYSTVGIDVYKEGDKIDFGNPYLEKLSPIGVSLFDERMLRSLR